MVIMVYSDICISFLSFTKQYPNFCKCDFILYDKLENLAYFIDCTSLTHNFFKI